MAEAQEGTPKKRSSLPVKVVRQWTSYSCTAAVAQMVAEYHDIRLGHRKAIALAKCKPDGATLPFVARALKREHGLQHKKLRSRAQVRAALRRGEPVMSNDSMTYDSDHAIIVIGETTKGF